MGLPTDPTGCKGKQTGRIYVVRCYQPGDRQAVWRVAADTAFFGDPVEAFLDDRDLYCAGLVAYYTDYEPAWLWVAETAGRVVGYVAGCPDDRRRARVVRTEILPALARGLLQGRYRIGRKTVCSTLRALGEVLQGAVPAVSRTQFPAHLHINVAAPARGKGIGRRLLETALERFWAQGVKGVHLLTTDRNVAACDLYEAMGFRLLDARRTRRWEGLVEGRVENRAYGIRPEWERRIGNLGGGDDRIHATRTPSGVA